MVAQEVQFVEFPALEKIQNPKLAPDVFVKRHSTLYTTNDINPFNYNMRALLSDFLFVTCVCVCVLTGGAVI